MKTTTPNADHPPSVYLSTSAGMFRVIQQGLPICADFPTEYQARLVADKFRLTLSPFVWNGDKGSFVAVES